MRKLLDMAHYDRISVFERFNVDGRIRYENGSVDANRLDAFSV